jgi:hypothetical protein
LDFILFAAHFALPASAFGMVRVVVRREGEKPRG